MRTKENNNNNNNNKKKNIDDSEWITVNASRPTVWLPSEGGVNDILEGKVVKFIDSAYGFQAVIETKDKQQFLTPSHKLLQSKIELLELYDVVKIVHSGLIKLPSGRKANDYVVMRKKRTEEIANELIEGGIIYNTK